MLESFKTATLKNAQNSIKEPGILRFDFIQQEDNPLNFLLVEVYKDSNAVAQHKETSHYNEWRQSVEHMIAEPRKSIKYVNIFPEDKAW
ncbi:MAG: antibiotic biosynthesis monooxygenase [Actinobacteria bacterium]|nr:antibiotic biosynthesis monooxygenase [Actinomycetota bacterium]